MLTIKCWHAKNGHTVTQPKDFVLSSYRTGGWKWGGVGPWKVARIQNVVVSRWQYDMSPRGGGNTFFFSFFLNWDMFPRGRNVRDHKIKDSASKVLQGAVKECFGWRLVQASSHFQPPLRENAPGETTKSERAVFKSPHSRRPGCGLFTVKSSAAIPKISPPPPELVLGAKQAAAGSDERTRQSSDTTETLKVWNTSESGKGKEQNAPVGNDWGGVSCVLTARTTHTAGQSETLTINQVTRNPICLKSNAGMHICHNNWQ